MGREGKNAVLISRWGDFNFRVSPYRWTKAGSKRDQTTKFVQQLTQRANHGLHSFGLNQLKSGLRTAGELK